MDIVSIINILNDFDRLDTDRNQLQKILDNLFLSKQQEAAFGEDRASLRECFYVFQP